MAYTVFALKWRPKNFDDLVGQPQVVSTLKNAIQKNTLAHAYLFAGPRGVGKTSTARILAKALNCKDGPTANPCHVCPSCQDIANGRSFDVIEIDGASNTGVDNIRELRESAKFSPSSGRFKIYIIDEVHMLSDAAFNALLKTLEEPPPYIKFIFATTHPQEIIPTVLSRCQRLNFRRIPALEISAQLERIVSAEKITIEKEVLFAIAKASDGSLRDAESILDQLASFSKDKISMNDVVSVLGLVEQDALFEITDCMIRKDGRAALGILNNIIDGGKDVSVFSENLIEHFRNLMVAKVTGGDSKLIDLPEDICTRLMQQAGALTLEEIFSAFNILVKTQELAKRLDSLRIPLEISLIRLTYHKTQAQETKPASTPKQEVVKPVAAKVEAPVIQKAPEKVKPAEPSVEPQAEISLEAVKQCWENIVNNLSKVKMSVATYLNEGRLLSVKGGCLIIGFPKSCSLHKEALESKENKVIIEKAVSDALNARVGVNFILSVEEPRKAEHESNAFLKSALDMFGGRIVREDNG